MQHPSERNIVNLIWNSNEPPKKTLCLMSSLNEGTPYPLDQTGYHPQTGQYTVAPRDLGALLDLYDDDNKFRCERAILCINSEMEPWTIADYQEAAGQIVLSSKHIFTHCVSLADDDLINISGAQGVPVSLISPVSLARRPSNEVAAFVRAAIGLL